MPSSRRVRLLAVAALTAIIMIIYFSSGSGEDWHRQKYMKQFREMGEKDRQNAETARQMGARLKEAEGEAKSRANMKSPPPPKEVVVETKKKAQDKIRESKGKENAQDVVKAGKGSKGDTRQKNELLKGQTQKQDLNGSQPNNKMDDLLTTILKRSPIIIFSKSYCHFSKKAKNILLNKYSITPAPHVVELDQIPEGPELQTFLGERTGRATVPNILVNGKSIGGGDDIEALDDGGQLADLLLKMGGKRFTKVEKNG